MEPKQINQENATLKKTTELLNPQEIWSALGLPGRRMVPHMGYLVLHECENPNSLRQELASFATEVDDWVASLEVVPRNEIVPAIYVQHKDAEPQPFVDTGEPPAITYDVLAEYMGGMLECDEELAMVHESLAYRSWVGAAVRIRRFIQVLQPEADAMLSELAAAYEVD